MTVDSTLLRWTLHVLLNIYFLFEPFTGDCRILTWFRCALNVTELVRPPTRTQSPGTRSGSSQYMLSRVLNDPFYPQRTTKQHVSVDEPRRKPVLGTLGLHCSCMRRGAQSISRFRLSCNCAHTVMNCVSVCVPRHQVLYQR